MACLHPVIMPLSIICTASSLFVRTRCVRPTTLLAIRVTRKRRCRGSCKRACAGAGTNWKHGPEIIPLAIVTLVAMSRGSHRLKSISFVRKAILSLPQEARRLHGLLAQECLVLEMSRPRGWRRAESGTQLLMFSLVIGIWKDSVKMLWA